jgi:hypothetical protein
MFGLPTSVRIYLAAAPADMRKGFDGLARLVEMHQLDLYSGHLFAFLSRRADRVKILGRRVRPPQYALVVNERGRLSWLHERSMVGRAAVAMTRGRVRACGLDRPGLRRWRGGHAATDGLAESGGPTSLGCARRARARCGGGRAADDGCDAEPGPPDDVDELRVGGGIVSHAVTVSRCADRRKGGGGDGDYRQGWAVR